MMIIQIIAFAACTLIPFQSLAFYKAIGKSPSYGSARKYPMPIYGKNPPPLTKRPNDKPSTPTPPPQPKQ